MTSKTAPDFMSRMESEVDSLGQAQSASPAPALAAGAGPAADDWGTRGREAVLRIPVSVQIVLGAVRMPVSKLMGLSRGSVIALDRKVGDLVDVVVNDRIVARGEVVALDDTSDKFAIAVREVVRGNEG